MLGSCTELTDERRVEAERVAEAAATPAASTVPKSSGSPRGAAEASTSDQARPPPRPEARVQQGTGDFLGEPSSVLGAGQVSRIGDITLNFVNADIREVVRSILGDILGQNYVLDPRVQGTITVETSRPLPEGALLPMLEQVLQLNGFALVRKQDNYLVLPMQEAINTAGVSGSFLSGGGVTRGYAISIVALEHISAPEMAAILEPMTPSGGVLRVDEARNVLIIAGTQQELKALSELIAIFDVDWMAGMSFAVVPLDYANAETLIAELEAVFGAGENGPLAGLVRFVPVERINSVLVIAKRPGHLEQARAWIDQLDLGEGQGAQRRLFVYYVKNGRAEELAQVLTDAFSPTGAAAPVARLAPGAERAVVGEDQPFRTAAATAEEAVAQRRLAQQDGAAPTEADAPRAPEGVAASAASRPLDSIEGIGLVEESDIRIIADDANNSLVVLASPREYRMIESALEKLDIVPLQVLIEATIAEVTLTDDLRYGVQWFLQEGNSGFSLSEAATGIASQVFPGFSYLLTGGADFRFVLNALEAVTDVNVISSPQLMVLDNQTAELQVGNEVPVATQQQQASTSGDAPLVNTIEFRDTGIILNVTPRVNPGGLVIMEIAQEVSSVVAGTGGTITPTIQQRRIESSIAVQSGETVALGGLIQDQRTRTKSGIPFLQSIPVLGELFSNTGDNNTRTELLVVITPRVVGNQDEARAVTEELRKKMRAVVPLSRRIEDRGIGVPLE